MKKTTLIIVLTLISYISSQVYAQDTIYKNNITFNISRLLLLEARFGYERYISERHSIRTNLGIQFPISESYRSINAIPFFIPFHYAVSKGIYIGFGYNYFIVPSKQVYLSSEIYYNYSYYDNKYYRNCTGQNKENYVTKQSMDLSKVGLKLLIGRKLSLVPKRNTRLKFDLFAGIGVQYRDEEITIFEKKTLECSVEGNYPYTVYDSPEIEVSKRWWPTLHGGILFGLPF